MSGISSIEAHPTDPLAAPVVTYAAHYRFSAGEVNPRNIVASRKLLWVIAGRGRLRTAGRTLTMEVGTVVMLPWRHDDRYWADRTDPFYVGTVHLVPWHDPAHPVVFRAVFKPGDPLWVDPSRRDVPWPGFESATVLHGALAERVVSFGEAVVQYFARGERDERVLRSYGAILTSTLLGAREEESPAIPVALRSILEYAQERLELPLDRADFARIAGCSVSTVERQFRRYLGRSPQVWLRETRLDLAARALTTSTRRVSEIAHELGFEDAFYFSRVFRARFGVPPSEYARREPML